MTTVEEVVIETEIPERSGLATAAFVCSVIICCPVTTVVGPILGLIALISLRGKPNVKGKGFALSAIVIGLLSTVLWAIVIPLSINWFVQFVEEVGDTATTTISAGYEGDYAEFRTNLTRSSATVTDDEIQEFIEELQSRYGEFDSAVFVYDRNVEDLQPTGIETPFAVRLVFETTDVEVDCMYEIVPQGGLEINLLIGCMLIHDAKNGDLVFPKGSYCEPSIPEIVPTTEEVDSEPTS